VGQHSEQSDLTDLVIRMDDVSVAPRPPPTLLARRSTGRWSWTSAWVVLGPNGAGKTTLLRMAAAELHPSSGSVHVLGERLGRVDRVRAAAARIGISARPRWAGRVPGDEIVRDVVISAGYALLGRWAGAVRHAGPANRADWLLDAPGHAGRWPGGCFGTPVGG